MKFNLPGLIGRALMLTILLISLSMTEFQKYPFEANFDVITARYMDNSYSTLCSSFMTKINSFRQIHDRCRIR